MRRSKGSKRAERRRRTLLKYIRRLQDHYNTNWTNSSFWKFKEECAHWLTLIKNTPKLCSRSCCCGPRRNTWLKKHARLSLAERKMLDEFEQQLKDLLDENPNIR